jgi:hypothetical protein
MSGTRRPYPGTFKWEAVDRVRSSGPSAGAAPPHHDLWQFSAVPVGRLPFRCIRAPEEL